MLWKNVNFYFKTLSITARLTLLYSLSAFSILFLATFFLYTILINSLVHEGEKFLRNEISILQTIIQQESEPVPVLRQELKEIAQHLYLARIIDDKGREVAVSPSLALGLSEFPKPMSLDRMSIIVNLHAPTRERYLLVSAWAKRGNSDERWLIEIALNLQHEYNIIQSYRNNLFMVLIVGVFCFALMGAIVARRGLAPLRNITKRMAKVTISQLHERLDSRQWPKEIVNLVNALNKLLERIETAFTRLSQFSADLAHELRTPINNLMGEAEIALSRARTSEEYRHVIESSLEEFQRLSRMIDSLLFLARSENPKTQIQKTSFCVLPILESIAEFHEAVAAEKNVTIICEGNAKLDADPILFRRAVSNLLSNALKYTSSGGRIILSTFYTEDNQVCIKVSDTGEGIPHEHLSKLFDRFYRVDEARSKHSGGTGLGLAIVKSIMDLHNGSIEITSEFGTGTTVILTFPTALSFNA